MPATDRTFGIDLRLVHASEAALPLTDLTFRRGYGAFDFLRVEEGVPLFLDDHLARLERSAEMLGLTPRPGPEQIAEHVRALIEANGAGTFGLQLFLTAGDPDDGFTPGRPRMLSVVVDPPRYPDAYYLDGVQLLAFPFQRDLPAAKTTNYFTAVRHARTLREQGAADLLYTHEGRALETTRSNIFVASDGGGWVTPEEGVLHGITRKHLIASLAPETPVEVRDVPLDELLAAREVIITSTTKGVMPVVAIDGRPIGDGRPGPMGRAASEAFAAHRDAWIRAYRRRANGVASGAPEGSTG